MGDGTEHRQRQLRAARNDGALPVPMPLRWRVQQLDAIGGVERRSDRLWPLARSDVVPSRGCSPTCKKRSEKRLWRGGSVPPLQSFPCQAVREVAISTRVPVTSPPIEIVALSPFRSGMQKGWNEVVFQQSFTYRPLGTVKFLR